MKQPLHYQLTDTDSPQISFINALYLLFDKEVLPSEKIEKIYSKTRKNMDKSRIEEIMPTLDSGLVKCTRLTKEEVTLDAIRECVEAGGVVLFKCPQYEEHYSIIVEMDEASAYIFDPHYVSNEHYNGDGEVSIVTTEPFKMNRIVRLSRLVSFSKKDFALGEVETRECVLIRAK